MQVAALEKMIQRQKLIWRAVVESLDTYIQMTGSESTPLKMELQLCTKIVVLFLESGDQNLKVARQTKNPRHVSTFSLLKSIILGTDLFSKAFSPIYRVSLFIELQKVSKNDLNQFEKTVVNLVRAVNELAKEVRELNNGPATSVSEAYEMASATMKLRNLFKQNSFPKNEVTRKCFRDFDNLLCSNAETSLLGCKAYENPNKSFLIKKSFILSEPQKSSESITSNQYNSAPISSSNLALNLLRLAKGINALSEATNLVLDTVLIQADAWTSAVDSPQFSYGVDRYKEKWEQDIVRMTDLCNGLTRVLSLLVAAAREVELQERNSTLSEVTMRPLMIELVNSALGYIIMTYWWWYQIAIGCDHLQKLLCFKKLHTPLREKFEATFAKNQDIVEEFQRDYAILKSMMSPLVPLMEQI